MRKDTEMDAMGCIGIIIEKDGEFLVGMGMHQLRWSNSPYDAWITRKREQAEKVAEKVNGRKMIFNPITGRREFERV